MRLSRRIALDGVQLDEIHSSIVIRGIDTGVPKESIAAVNRMGGSGQRITTQHWETMDVAVRFAINVPKRQMALRREVWESVMAWALKGGWLTVGYMPDRRLYVDKAILPGSGDLWNWTEEFTITFRAYNVPFWQDANPNAVAVRGVSSWSGTLGVPGHFRTVADVTFRNTSGSAMTAFLVTAGGNTLALSGISLTSGAELLIHHGTDGLLRITAGGVSVYNKLTESSSDDLYLDPGTAAISVTAGRSGNVTVSCFGRYA